MSLSARLLGEKFGLNAQEMNRVLVKFGIIEGTPGNYTLTELGEKYACVKDYHRGCGGYDFYNRYWTTTSYDESILDLLNVTDEIRKSAIAEVNEYRALQRANRALEFAKDEAEQLAKAQKIVDDQMISSRNIKVAGISAGVIVCLIAASIIAYCVAPKIKAHFIKRKKEKAKSVEDNDENITCDNTYDKTLS